jgi:hypothetical protein
VSFGYEKGMRKRENKSSESKIEERKSGKKWNGANVDKKDAGGVNIGQLQEGAKYSL